MLKKESNEHKFIIFKSKADKSRILGIAYTISNLYLSQLIKDSSNVNSNY